LSKDCIKACYEYCKEHEDELDTAYRNKVYIEFVKAMKEADEAKPVRASKDTNGQDDGDESDDVILEAMLDAEEGGYGEFQDDFDEMNEESPGENDANENDDSDDEENGATFLFGKRPFDVSDSKSNGKKAKTKEDS
jgi:hypothetical protein